MRQLFAVLIFMTGIACGEEAPAPKWFLPVRIQVKGPESFTTLVTSYLSRELRNFKDIEIAPTDPAYTIRVLGLDNTLTNGKTVGLAVHVLVLQHVDYYADAILSPSKETSDTTKLVVRGFTQNAVIVESDYIFTGTYGDLELACAQIIANADTKIFQESRRLKDLIPMKRNR